VLVKKSRPPPRRRTGSAKVPVTTFSPIGHSAFTRAHEAVRESDLVRTDCFQRTGGLVRIRFLASLLVVLAAAPAAAQAKTTITLSGSTSVAPLATKLAKAYVKA